MTMDAYRRLAYFAFFLLTLTISVKSQYMEGIKGSGRMLNPLNGNHSQAYQTLFFSLLDGTSDISGLAERALRFGLSSLESKLDDTCLSHMEIFLHAVVSRQQWALRMVDAMGKPSSGILEGNMKWLGSYDECFAVKASVNNSDETITPFSGQYCLASFPLNIGGRQNAISESSTTLMMGTCFPSSCAKDDVTALINAVLHLAPINKTTIPKPRVSCNPEQNDLDTKAIIVIVVCSIFGLLILTATAYDMFVVHFVKTLPESLPQQQVPQAIHIVSINEPATNGVLGMKGNDNPDASLKNRDIHVLSNGNVTKKVLEGTSCSNTYQPGKLGQILLSFSMYKNTVKILNTKQPPGALSAVNGIRFLSMSWVILGHGVGYTMSIANNMATFAPKMFKRFTFQVIANGTLSVDTFFTLSGLLVAYLSLKEMKKRGGAKRFNWGMFYFHRFWRLTPPYMLFLMFYVCLTKYFANGPMWTKYGLEKDDCKDTWWKNLLYVNNLVDSKNQCMGWGWYLANDMQFFVVSPIMLIPLYYSSVLGSLACLSMVLINLIYVGVIAHRNHLNANFILDTTRNDAVNEIYSKPWSRIGPYAVGIFTGYLLYRTKCKVKMPKIVSSIGWLSATAVGLLVVYGLYNSSGGLPDFSSNISALYIATHRTAWGAAVCWVIFACATGYGGLVNSILSWKAVIPLARLTYCAYLVHLVVMYVYFMSKRSLVYLTDLEEIYIHLGNLVISYAVAFVVSLAFEAPMMGLEKVLLGRGKNS